MNNDPAPSLRERKQQRTRRGLIDAAMSLFAERGFENVTVTEIADAAEVGRTTFFRYFDDKQEVLFARDDELLDKVASVLDQAAQPEVPLGDSIETALVVLRAGLQALSSAIVQDARWLPERERLIQENTSLQARNLLKQNRFLNMSIDRLVQHGANRRSATLAAGIAAACYATAYAAAADDPARRLPDAIDTALKQVTALDPTPLAAKLKSSSLQS